MGGFVASLFMGLSDSDGFNGGGIVVELPLQSVGIEKINDVWYYVSESIASDSSVDMITFQHVTFSPLYRYDPPRYTYSDILFSDGTEETLGVLFDYPVFTEHVKPHVGLVETSDGIKFLVSIDLKELSPLKQFKSGVPIYEIECKETLLLIKKHDGTPICITPETREKLIERGWDAPILVSVIREAPTVYLDPVDISSTNNQFAIDFYSNLTQNDSTSNVFFSPISISTAFSILYEGARQNTSQEIQNVFGFPEEEQKRRSGYMSLHQSINEKSNTDTTMSIANALWLAENFEPLAEYIDTAMTFYDSTVDTVDFASDDGINRINEWIDEKTQGKITDILKPGSTSSNTKMAITNAIYFKGLWEYPFDPEDTYASEFMVDKDNYVDVQMMTFPYKMQVNYAVTETMEMIELPYRNGTLSLLIILPNEMDDLRTVEESITTDNLKMWKDFPTLNRGINIHIPKFTLETEYNLKEHLPDMGMPTVFNPVHADLSGITGYKSLYVSQAIHKAFVEVNEKGTEAAGATVIVTDESGGQTFKADHPFVFIIQDNETDNILFMGRVVDPTK